MPLTLAQYLQRTQRLLTDVKFEKYNPYDLIEYVNEGRMQIAGESACIKVQGSLTTTATQQVYDNSSVVLPANEGFNGAIAIERIWYIDSNPANNPILLDGRSWGWFNLYWLTLGRPPPGIPAAWAQYLQGPLGSFYIGPVPNGPYSLIMDTTALPAAMSAATVATDVDAIPYPWSDAVPFYAASLALRGEKMVDEADAMLQQYEQYVSRAGVGVTPSAQSRSFPARSALAASDRRQPPSRANSGQAP